MFLWKSIPFTIKKYLAFYLSVSLSQKRGIAFFLLKCISYFIKAYYPLLSQNDKIFTIMGIMLSDQSVSPSLLSCIAFLLKCMIFITKEYQLFRLGVFLSIPLDHDSSSNPKTITICWSSYHIFCTINDNKYHRFK